MGEASTGSGSSPGKIVNGWANLAKNGKEEKTGKDENNGKEEKTSKDEVKQDPTEENNMGEKENPKIVLGSKNNDKQDPQISKDEKLPFKVQFLMDPHPIIVLPCHSLTQLVGTFVFFANIGEIVQK